MCAERRGDEREAAGAAQHGGENHQEDGELHLNHMLHRLFIMCLRQQ